MFDVGFAELFLLTVIGLLVLGPERLPAVARTLGGFMRKARSSWYTLKRTIEAELAEADLKQPLQAARKEFEDLSRDVSELGGESTDKPNTPDKPEQPDKPDKPEQPDKAGRPD